MNQDPDPQEEESGQGISSFSPDCDEFGFRSDTTLLLRCPVEFVVSGLNLLIFLLFYFRYELSSSVGFSYDGLLKPKC